MAYYWDLIYLLLYPTAIHILQLKIAFAWKTILLALPDLAGVHSSADLRSSSDHSFLSSSY